MGAVMAPTARTLVLALALALSACGASQRQSFDETAALFHDDLRWGRIPAAETSVSPAIRTAFSEHQRAWGAVVHVIDIEVESMRTSSSSSSARLRVVWTHGTDSTDVRESLVEEAWESSGGRWVLRNESVIAGDAGLFGAPAGAPGATPAAPARDESVPTPNA